jgi:protein-tyrosine phosphatase
VRYIVAVVFTVFASYLAVLAVKFGGFGLALFWPAISFLIAAAGYAGLGPWVFGKRSDGTLAPVAVVLLLPFLLFTWSIWHGQRLLTREPACCEVVPGLWLGRRPLAHELPEGVDLVVDLTAEFAEPARVRIGRSYVSLPTLDSSVPDAAAFRAMVHRVADHGGPVYIHCALGHGRSGMFISAVLLRRGHAADVREALALVRRVRAAVRLKPEQRRLLERFATEPRTAVPQS